MTIFDACIVAARILWNTSTKENESHYEFKKQLAYEMCLPVCQRRVQIPKLRSTIRQALETIGKEGTTVKPVDISINKKGRCHLCPRQKDTKVQRCCSDCLRSVCKQHSITNIKCNRCQ